MNNIIQTIRHTARAATVLLLALLAAQTAGAETNVSNADGLEDALDDEDVSVINVTDNITGVGILPSIERTLTINLNGHTISGDGLHIDVDSGCSLTINGEGQDGSVGNIISGNANQSAIDNSGTVTLSHVNITTNSYHAIGGGVTLNIGNNVSFNGWTERPFITQSVNIIEGGNYNYDPENYDPFANVVATVTVGGKTHNFENLGAALVYIAKHPDTTLDMPDLSADFSWSGDTYTIHTDTGWDFFCDMLEAGETFSGKTVELANDITVTRMAGGQPFTGTFDGQNHKLTLAYGTADAPVDAQFVAPFVETARDTSPVFRNLTIDGTIYATHTAATDHDHVGGLIGHLFGDVTIEHCVSRVEIHAKGGAGGFVGLCEHSVSFTDCHSAAVVHSADGSNSGFVAWSRDSGWEINFTGCLFDGKLLQQNGTGHSNGGFIGWKGDAKTVNITNCLCAPATLADGEKMASSNSATFARGWNATTTATNSYYTAAFDIAQGKARHTVTAGTDVTIEAIALTGTATQYTVSGITAYSGGGLQRGETLYYGIDDQLSLTLTTSAQCDQPGYQYGYTASAGTLSGTTLTMPDEDVTISVNTATLATIDWATVNQGDSAEDPYMIYNKDQLLLLAHRVNGTNDETAVNNGYYGKFFKLGADITFDHPAAETDNYAENYEAIGSTYSYFRGTFDGDGHTVSGIRIRKDGSGTADYCQGLFGCIGIGAEIHDVHLTDARIKGNANVGGIAGYKAAGNIMRCTVTDSYITATGIRYYGTISGTNNGGTLTNNYYHGCTVNGTKNATNVGCTLLTGIADLDDEDNNNGALPAYRLALGANITTPPGTFVDQTEWLDTPPVGARLAPENGFTLAGNHYFASGYVFTPGSTLASGAAQGYTPRATLGDVLLDLYTPTGDDDPLAGKAIARLTITADCDGKTLASTEAIYSTRQPVTVAYIKADGTPGEASAIALDGTEPGLGEGWYFVCTDIAFDHTLDLSSDVHLILADGCTMNITSNGNGIDVNGSLTIYGQTDGTGTLNATSENDTGICTDGGTITICGGTVTTTGDNEDIHSENGNITISGGTVTATGGNGGIHSESGNITISGGTVTATGGGDGIFTYGGTITISGGRVTATGGTGINNYGGTITISGGTVTATSDNGYGIYTDGGTITISGGRVTATGNYGIYIYSSGTITLGCTTASDFIYASSYGVGSVGRLNIADGQTLYDEDGIFYSGNGVAIPAGKTLRLYGIDLTARQAPDGNFWTTYYNGTTGFTIDADEHACAYTATYGGSQLTLKKLGKEIPAGTAVIIVADNDEVSMTAATDLGAFSGDNDLRGVDVDTQTSALGTGTFYVLGMTTVGGEKHFGFHRYTGEEMAAHKAYVLVDNSQARTRPRPLSTGSPSTVAVCRPSPPPPASTSTTDAR